VVSPVSAGQSQPQQLDSPAQTFPQSQTQYQPVVAPVSTGADGRGNANRGNANNRLGNDRKPSPDKSGCLMM